MTTMKEIADVAGVSVATVSKILNGLDQHISDATRKRILEIVEETGYVPNAVAKGLKIKRTNMIGFILPDISNPFFPQVAKGIEDAARKRGFGVIISNTDDTASSEREVLRFLSSRMVDGIVFVRTLRGDNVEKCLSTGIPVVLVDREVDVEGMGAGQIVVDTQRGIYESTMALIRSGCRRVAFISALYRSEHDRFHGYRRALEESGMPVDEALVYRHLYNVETGYDGIGRILQHTAVDGVVCGNDLIAVGVMNRLKELGLGIPNDVKIMGFDDIYIAQHLTPSLSTVCQPTYEMGMEAATMLIDNIVDGTPLYQKELDFHLVMRETV